MLDIMDELKIQFDILKEKRDARRNWKPHPMMYDYEDQDLSSEVSGQEEVVLDLLEQLLYPDLGANI